jgi:hypothetical protein
MLRHQLAALQRRQPGRPKLNWADRALLATLLGVIPKARRQGLRLLITPDTIVRWHRDIVRRRWGARSVHPRQDRPASDPPEHPGPGPSAGPREPRLGVPQDPRRAGRTRRKGRSIHRVGDPQGQRHRSRPAADRADLVAIPALPGRGDPGLRLLHSRPARRHAGLRPGRDRPRNPPHQRPRTHLAPNRGMDHPAGPQPDHGSRRPRQPGQVHDPRPRLELHHRVRCRPRRRPGSGPCSAASRHPG